MFHVSLTASQRGETQSDMCEIAGASVQFPPVLIGMNYWGNFMVFSPPDSHSFDHRIWGIPRITTLFADLVLDTGDENVHKVLTKSLIKWDAELLEAPRVNVSSGMSTLFNNLIQ
jgi:hypothetical protein